MAFVSNQAVWIVDNDASWKPGIIVDDDTSLLINSTNDKLPLSFGHQFVYIFETNKVEMMDETNIRDFCASYCELYDADNGGRRSSNTVDILIRQAVHMSNRLNELEHTTLHQWAIDNFIDHPPILYISGQLLNMFSVVNEICQKICDAKRNNRPPPATLVWALTKNQIGIRWWPSVIVSEMTDDDIRVVALCEPPKIFEVQSTEMVDFCTGFRRRIEFSAIEQTPPDVAYMTALEKAIKFVQKSVDDFDQSSSISCLDWAHQNIAKYSNIQVTGTDWFEILSRTKDDPLLVGRSITNDKQQTRSISSEPLGSSREQIEVDYNRSNSTPRELGPLTSNEISEMDNRVRSSHQSNNTMEMILKRNNHSNDDAPKPAKARKSLRSSKTTNGDDNGRAPRIEQKLDKQRARKSMIPSKRTPNAGKSSSSPTLKSPKYSSTPTFSNKNAHQMSSPSSSKSRIFSSAGDGTSSGMLKKKTSKSGGGRRNTIVDTELLKEPLDRGWLREIVVRASSEKKISDVYYRYPSGVKFSLGKARSGKDIERLLQDNMSHAACRDLDRDHFSFNGTIITNHPREYVHHAGEKVPDHVLAEL